VKARHITGKLSGWTGPAASVYAVQCHTFGIARQLLGVEGDSLTTRVDMARPVPADALTRFRALPAYRTPAARQLRTIVAAKVWEARQGRAAQ
jgi:hypothetical protein